MMAGLHLVVLMLAMLQHGLADPMTDGTKLVFTYIVNRHGDRAPQKQSLELIAKSVNMDVVEKKVAKYGYEQLTGDGKRRAHDLGKFLRSRYDNLLSKTYDPSELLIRSDHYTRTKETLKLEMAGLYPSQSKVLNNTVKYQPVPESVVNNTYDILEFTQHCSVFSKHFQNSFRCSYPSISALYPSLLTKLSNITGHNITSRPGLTYVIHDAYLSLQNIGYKLKPEIEAVMPELEKASGDALDVLLGQQEYLPLEAGVLLDDFFTIANEVSKRTTKEKMRLNSGHDTNVYSMKMVSGATPILGVPYYCSLFALELRRVIKTGKLVVLLVYLPKPGEQVQYLRVRGCGGFLCEYNTFKGITRGSTITAFEYHKRCQANVTSSQ